MIGRGFIVLQYQESIIRNKFEGMLASCNRTYD